MTLKEFMTAVVYLPASVFSGLVKLVLGSTQKVNKPLLIEDEESEFEEKINPGLLGLLLDGVKFLGRSLADFVAQHKKAITISFWTSLALAGAAALTVFLWPAALTAITTFSIYGFSIAGVVGANTMLQIGAVAALTFAATSVSAYLAAAVINTVNAIRDCFKRTERKEDFSSDSGTELLELEHESAEPQSNPLSILSQTTPDERPLKTEQPPHQGATSATFTKKIPSKENPTPTPIDSTFASASSSM